MRVRAQPRESYLEAIALVRLAGGRADDLAFVAVHDAVAAPERLARSREEDGAAVVERDLDYIVIGVVVVV